VKELDCQPFSECLASLGRNYFDDYGIVPLQPFQLEYELSDKNSDACCGVGRQHQSRYTTQSLNRNMV
jgi:hypothetical protein